MTVPSKLGAYSQEFIGPGVEDSIMGGRCDIRADQIISQSLTFVSDFFERSRSIDKTDTSIPR